MANVLMVCMQVVLAVAGGKPDSGEWTRKDIGNSTIAGTAQYNEEAMIWTVRGNGADIWGAVDGFQYVSRPFRGDGFIVAKVEDISKVNSGAKCGIMIRESLDPNSSFAAIYAAPSQGIRFQARIRKGAGAISDTSVASKEQRVVKVPVWIKLERKGNQYYGYYATDAAGKAWTSMAWKPPAIEMSKTACAGLAVCSLQTGVLCEARFSNVTIATTASGITDIEILAHPEETLREAYKNLEQLGNWRADPEIVKKHGTMIGSSLFTIARIRELRQEASDAVLPDYYRMVEILPETPSTVQALIRITILDGEKGLKCARRCLDARSPEDKDAFYVAVMKDYGHRPDTPERKAVFESLVEYVAQSARFAALEQVIAALEPDEQGISACQSLIQCGMTQPANVGVAVVGLRYMAWKMLKGQAGSRASSLLQWAATQFKDTKLTPCAVAALADMYYEQGSYAKVIETLQPEIFSGGSSGTNIVEIVESTLASYRANTLLQATINPERIYVALGEKAGASGQHVLHLHCQRKVAELRGLSLEDFEKSVLQGVKYCESGADNEVWFWKGLIAADAGDLGSATTAYQHFLQQDGKSLLAARAYYDIARLKMAIGEDAKPWIAKAKALSPCGVVVQLERRLATTTSARKQG